MDGNFINEYLLNYGPWQAMERAVARLMEHGDFNNVRLVGRTGDGGADIIAERNQKRWVVQVKYRSNTYIEKSAVDEVLKASSLYHGDIPVVATNASINNDLIQRRKELHASGINLQVWDRAYLTHNANLLSDSSSKLVEPRNYQEEGILQIVERVSSGKDNSGIVIMATGLGKTFVIGESLRRLILKNNDSLGRILILAHTNEIVYQLEKSLWRFLPKYCTTAVWNGNERGDISNAKVVFACIDSVISSIDMDTMPADFRMIVIDEAHHAGSQSYKKLLAYTQAGKKNGPYLIGMTATPWRSDENDIKLIFGKPFCTIDIIEGMKNGFLTNVDYRMYLDNIDWKKLRDIKNLTPKGLNKTLFIEEWDDGVLRVINNTWSEIIKPKAIIFCSTINHALKMRDKINAMQFCRAEAIYSGTHNGVTMKPIDRSVVLQDFADGRIQIICAVDIFNEGIDVPDVNLLVFQRVTHSRRIFVQQLGRGLRISPEKNKVIVLDFVSDIRRIAAGLELNEKLERTPRYIQLGKPVIFMTQQGEDEKKESFLKQWLKDVTAIQDAGDDEHILKFPPKEQIDSLM